jgi:hypothetical protein
MLRNRATQRGRARYATGSLEAGASPVAAAHHRHVTFGNISGPKANRGDDTYETPREAIESLLAVEQLPSRVWEPFVGQSDRIGSTLRAHGHEVIATGLLTGDDFFTQTEAPSGCGLIVSNPPYIRAADAVRHGLKIAPSVIFLLRLTFLESERGSDILDGGRLARVHLFANRLPRMHRFDWQGARLDQEACAHAWFVWRRDYRGPIVVNRIRWTATKSDRELAL